MKSIMTVDLEYDWDSNKTESLVSVVPKLLDMFDEHDIKATFFIVGSLIPKFEDLIKEIQKKHELASHSFSHCNLGKLSYEQLDEEIKDSKNAVESVGMRCKGFRAPFFITHPQLFEVLKKNGFSYDSSLSTFFPGRYFHPFTKTRPFKKEGIVELPIPNYLPFLLPAGFSYYRLFYPLSGLFSMRYMLYLHPCEFLEKGPGKDVHFFVRQLYKVNKGDKAREIFNMLLSKRETKWVTCSQYIQKI